MDNIDNKLNALAKQAVLIKNDTAKRHKPNAHDLDVVSTHTKIMETAQYQAVKMSK